MRMELKQGQIWSGNKVKQGSKMRKRQNRTGQGKTKETNQTNWAMLENGTQRSTVDWQGIILRLS